MFILTCHALYSVIKSAYFKINLLQKIVFQMTKTTTHDGGSTYQILILQQIPEQRVSRLTDFVNFYSAHCWLQHLRRP